MPVIDREDVDGLIPEGYVTEIISGAVAESLALSTFRRVNLGTKINNLPLLDVLPTAKWVTGEVSNDTPDEGLKSTTGATWTSKVLTAEEIATIAVVPEAVVDDAGGTRLWDALLPHLAEAVGRALDAAVFFGVNAPTTFPTGGIKAGATAAGNVVAGTATPDAAKFNASLAAVEADGYTNRVVYAGTAQKAGFRGWNAGGIPIYLTDLRSDSVVDSIYGIPVVYDSFGLFAANGVHAINGDSDLAILGVRQDMTLKFLDQATIDVSAAGDGSALVHLAQQDAVAYRLKARFGFVVANPQTGVGGASATRYPFSVITNP